MIYCVCVVRDSAAQLFHPPMYVRAAGEAIRGFGDEVMKSGTPLNAHPADYELFEIGAYDDSTGRVIMHEELRSLARGKDFVKEK